MLKKRFSNQLTQLIDEDGQNTDLETVLSHPLLSTTVRNDAKSIIDYFFYTDTENVQNTNKYFNELVRLALGITDYNQEQADQIPYLYNRNAANVLSSGSKQIYIKGSTSEDQFIFKSLRSFISSPKNTDPLFAGNFARLFIKWYQKSPDDFDENDEDDFSVTKLLDHAIENVSNAGYSDLLERFLSGDLDEIDGIDEFKAHIIDSILTKLRDSVGKPVENGQSSKDAKSVPIKETTSFTKYRYQQFKDHKQIYESSQQFTREKFRYPVPSYFYDVRQTPILSVKILPPAKPIDHSIQYLLITVFWSAAYENPTILDFGVDNDEAYHFIEKLLTIGIFGCENNMLCSTVFKILNIIINGNTSVDIQPLRERLPKEKWEKYHNLLQNYVKYIYYDPENVSALAVFSFPIFWNIKWENEKSRSKPEDSMEFKFTLYHKVVPKGGKRKSETYKSNSDYLMPCQILAPAIFTEPPLSDELNKYYVDLLGRMSIERYRLLKLIGGGLPKWEPLREPPDPENPDNESFWVKSIEHDKFYLDLVTYKIPIKLPNDPNPKPITFLKLLEKLFPINPHVYELEHKYRIKGKNDPAFPVINSAFYQATRFLFRTSELQCYFIIPSPVVNMRSQSNQLPKKLARSEFRIDLQDSQNQIIQDEGIKILQEKCEVSKDIIRENDYIETLEISYQRYKSIYDQSVTFVASISSEIRQVDDLGIPNGSEFYTRKQNWQTENALLELDSTQ